MQYTHTLVRVYIFSTENASASKSTWLHLIAFYYYLSSCLIEPENEGGLPPPAIVMERSPVQRVHDSSCMGTWMNACTCNYMHVQLKCTLYVASCACMYSSLYMYVHSLYMYSVDSNIAIVIIPTHTTCTYWTSAFLFFYWRRVFFYFQKC